MLSAIPVIAIGAAVIARDIPANSNRQNEELATATKLASNCITNIVTLKCFNTQVEEPNNFAAAIERATVFALRQSFSSSLQIGFVRFASIAMFVQGK